MTGAATPAVAAPAAAPPAPVVELRGVSLALRGMPVLEDVHMTLGPDEFVAIIGPNGGGKTVLLKVVLGLLRPDRGTVRVFGRPPAEARGLVAYVPQYAGFDRDFPITVGDVVLMGRLGRATGGPGVGAGAEALAGGGALLAGGDGGPARRGRGLRRLDEADHARARRAMESLGIDDLAGRQIGRLSGGQLQRVLIARALATDARLLLLDEPTSGLDPRREVELYELLETVARGRTIVLISHDVGIVSKHVRSVGCLNVRLHYHHSREITREMIEETYGCPVDFVVHRHDHRVLGDHAEGERAEGGRAEGGRGAGDGPRGAGRGEG